MKTTVDTKALKKDIAKLGKHVSKSADNAVRVTVEQSSAFYMQFDELYSEPFVKNKSGMIVVSGSSLADSPSSLEEIMAIQTHKAVATLQDVLQQGIKEALK